MHRARIALLVLATTFLFAGCAATSADTPHPGAEAPTQVGAQVSPTRVDVASIGAHSTLTQVDLDANHELATPPVSAPGQAAWFRRSSIPGNGGGIPPVIVGHINGGGTPGVFANLAQVKPGAEIDVARSDGTTAVFTVRKVDVVPKASFPTAAVYSATGNPQLRLISCGGDLDRTAHNYLDQVLVYADLVGAHRT